MPRTYRPTPTKRKTEEETVPLPRISTKPKPVPIVKPVPVPSPALEGLRQQEPISPTLPVLPGATAVQRLLDSIFGGSQLQRQSLPEPIRPLSGVLRAGLEPFQRRRVERAFTQADLPATGMPAISVPVEPLTRGPRPTGFIRAYWQTASSLTRGVRPRFITFLSQEALGLSEEDMVDALGYVKVAGGWVRRDEWTQTVSNVYGGPNTRERPVTVRVTGGGGRGGGGTRQQSSHLVNWRI